MQVDVTGRRKEFFTFPSAAQVLRAKGVSPSTFKNFQEVQELLNQGRFVSAATESHASAAIRGEVTNQSLVSAASKLRPHQVLVIPKSAYVDKLEAHNLRNYQSSAFPDVEWVAAARAFTGDERFTRWTDDLRISYQATPNRLLAPTVDSYSSSTPFMGYRFGDNVVEWGHVWMGSELRVWQNKFGYLDAISSLEEQLDVLAARERAKGVSLAFEKRQVRGKLALYQGRVEDYGIAEEAYQLASAGHDCLDDLVRTSKTAPSIKALYYGRNQFVYAPAQWGVELFQRTDPSEKRQVFFDDLPLVPRGMREASAALVHKLGASTYSLNERYANMAGRGAPWISEAVAGLHSLARVVEQVDSIRFYDPQRRRFSSGSFVMGEVPFPVPTRAGIGFADVLRYDAVFLEEEGGRVVSDNINLATFSSLLGAKLLVDGFSESLTVNKQELYLRGEDPMRYAVTLRYDDTNPV